MSLTRMLELSGSLLNANLVYKILECSGVVKRVFYDSTTDGKVKSFMVVEDRWLHLGKNKPSRFHPAISDIEFKPNSLVEILLICSDHFKAEAAQVDQGVDVPVKSLSNQTFVLTGTLNKMDRSVAKEYLKSLGAKVTGSVSSNTRFLVAGENTGSKLQKALDLGVEIINECEFIQLLSEHGIVSDS